MVIRSSTLIALVALALAACGGGDTQPGAGTGTTQPAPAPVDGQSANRCTSLTASDLTRIASIEPSQQQSLANSPGQRIRCSILFIDSSGQLILELRETGGDLAALTALRRATASDVGAAAVQPLPSLGRGAFLARRVLAFARGGSIVVLQTGYAADGGLQLTSAQLLRLAVIVSSGDS